MISERELRANRANARASAGPRTAAGRARAAVNARKHGLRVPVISDPTLSAEVARLAEEIAGPGASLELRERAQRVAEAQVDLVRVRAARHHVMSTALRSPAAVNESDSPAKVEGAEKLALLLPHLTAKLALIDLYERRAFSRRKAAIRAFDAFRRERAERH